MKTLRPAAFLLVAALALSSGCASSNASDKDPVGEEQAEQVEQQGEHAQKAESSNQAQQTGQAKKAKPRAKLPVYAIGTVAIVNGQVITAEDFNSRVEHRVRAMGDQFPPRLANMMKTRTVDRMIDERLVDELLEEHADELSVDEAEVDEELAEFGERFPDQAAFETFLTRNGLTKEKMKENLRKDLLLRRLLRKRYGVGVTDQEVRDHYDANSAQFEQGEQVHARHILIKLSKGAPDDEVSEAKARAQELSKMAQKPGADFGALAKEHSEGPSASRGGDLGFFEHSRMVPEFADAAFAMKPGEVSAPVRSQFGFHVILVEDVRPEGKVSFAEVEERLRDQLERKRYREGMETLLTDLKADALIERKPDNIKVNVEQTNQQQMNQLPPELKKKLQEQMKQRQKNQKNQQN